MTTLSVASKGSNSPGSLSQWLDPKMWVSQVHESDILQMILQNALSFEKT